MSDENLSELPTEGVLEIARRRDHAFAVIESVKRMVETELTLDRRRQYAGAFRSFFRWLAAAVIFGLLGYFLAKEWYFGTAISLIACLIIFNAEASDSKQLEAIQYRFEELRFRWISCGHRPSDFDELMGLARTSSQKGVATNCDNWWDSVQWRNVNTVRSLYGLPEVSKSAPVS